MKTVFRFRPGWVVLWIATGWLGVGGGRAQEPTPWREPSETRFDFDAGREWRGMLPAPGEVLGYAVGEAYADYGAFLRLLERYRGSERMRIVPTGSTNERRPMHVLVISASENLARLEAIKAANQRLVDGRHPLAERERDALLEKQPIIVWLSYNIHGDEAAGLEAAMQVLHTLLDDESEEVRGWLRDVVVVMNPCQNPDGRERFVVWANAHGIGRPETFAYEKENPWNVQGRYNHYYFDLNRDMIALSQVESRNTAAAYLEWMPQVAADHHGETKEYFFPPAALPINPHLPRAQTEHWQDVFGRANAAAFDAQRWMYYIRDIFDVFYPGYWDSWPSLQGATGMTYETSGGGKAGFNLRRDDGSVMTLRQAIAKHYVASLSTIRTAAANREARLRDFHAFFVAAVEAGRTGDAQQVWVPWGDEPDRARQLMATLVAHGIEVQLMEAPVLLADARDSRGRPVTQVTVPAPAFLIDLSQPRGAIARALLEPHTAGDEAFLARQLDKVATNRRRGENVAADDYEFYDLTAWSLPLLQGIEAFTTGQRLTVATVPMNARSLSPDGPSSYRHPGDPVAWVIPPGSDWSQRQAARLLREGYRVSVSPRPMNLDGRELPRGAFILRAERNPVDLDQQLARWAGSTLGPRPLALVTAATDTGNTGVGSESVIALHPPKVLVAVDTPVVASAYGALRFLLENDLGIDFVPVAAKRLRDLDLRAFNVVILPAGDPDGWERVLGENGRTHLKAWVEAGGTLICLGATVEFVAAEDTGWTTASVVGRENPEEEGESAPVDFDDRPLPVPGALLRARIDREHFLGFGYAVEELPYLVEGDVFLSPSTTGTNVVVFAEQDLWIAGHLWPDNTARLLAGTAAIVDEPVGEGHIILFTDQPGHRALWMGSVRALGNAILYSPGLRNDVGSYVR